jgi:hypothetical protein
VAARHFLFLSDKETKQRKRFHHSKNQVSTACSFNSLVPEEHGARQNHQCVKPSFSVHRYPHASPQVTEPAQGSPRAIREKPPTKFVRIPNHFTNPPRNEVAECGATPEITVQAEQLTREELRRQKGVRRNRSAEHGC